jgi:hypothetical protein
MYIPRVLQYPERKPKTRPSRSSHANSLERLLAWNYQISAAEEDQTSVSTAIQLPPESALHNQSHGSNLKDGPSYTKTSHSSFHSPLQNLSRPDHNSAAFITPAFSADIIA